MKSKEKISICIPFYNAEERIEETLIAIDKAVQKISEVAEVEVIAVDNASTDASALVIENYWKSNNASYSRRCVSEARQGVTHARMRAWSEASGGILVYCDDDVTPDEDSLRVILGIAESEARVGGGGGVITGVLEQGVEWPAWLDVSLRANLALTSVGLAPIYSPPDSYLPVSALVWFRHEALREWVNFIQYSSDYVLGPSGKEMWRGDDHEMDILVQRGGWVLKYDPAIRAEHRIPASRLTTKYMLSLLYWNGRSTMRLNNRWGRGGWLYCFSRVAYNLFFRRVKRSVEFLLGRRKSIYQRFRLDQLVEDREIRAMLDVVFRAGIFDEMIEKIISPRRF